jgi:hypothetical protein
VFGELAVVGYHHNRKVRSKLADRGRVCVSIGTADQHPIDTYRFFDLQTQRIIVSRDVAWMGKMYGPWKGIKPGMKVPDGEFEDADDIFPSNPTADEVEVVDRPPPC